MCVRVCLCARVQVFHMSVFLGVVVCVIFTHYGAAAAARSLPLLSPLDLRIAAGARPGTASHCEGSLTVKRFGSRGEGHMTTHTLSHTLCLSVCLSVCLSHTHRATAISHTCLCH